MRFLYKIITFFIFAINFLLAQNKNPEIHNLKINNIKLPIDKIGNFVSNDQDYGAIFDSINFINSKGFWLRGEIESTSSLPTQIIQSIDFTDDGKMVFGITYYGYSASLVEYDYKNNIWNEWNLTEMFNLGFYWVSTFVDEDENYWAIQQNEIYKYNGNEWINIEIPIKGYLKYADITQDNDGNIWISANQSLISIISDTLILDNSSENKELPTDAVYGEIFVDGDSLWVCTSKGLVLSYNNEITILDTLTSKIPSQVIYSFLIDSQRRRWIGSSDKGLIEWIDDTTFTVYNTENTNLTNNFINAIREDSKGKIWFTTDDGLASLDNGIVEIQPSAVEGWSVITLEIDSLDNIWLGTMHYGLYLYNENGLQSITGIEESVTILEKFVLSQNYPNPFNPTTTIKYQIPMLETLHATSVQLKVFDILGREIKILVDQKQRPGNYDVNFNASNLASGVYYYQLKVGSFIKTKKMVVMK